MAALDDFIDIIISNDHYKQKLIFQNTKFQSNGKIYERVLEELKKRGHDRKEVLAFSVGQLRQKFKKCTQECKKVALTIKTASGIQNFIAEKGYGAWFNQLYALVKTRDSCDPEQALEPTTASKTTCPTNHNTSTSREDSAGSSTEAESGLDKEKQKSLFVPVKNKKRKIKQDPLSEAIQMMKQVIENDPTKDLIKFIKEDIDKSREHELKLVQMMMAAGNQQVPLAQQNPGYVPQQFQNAQTPICGGFNQSYPTNTPVGQHFFAQELPIQQGHQFRPISPSQMPRPTSATSYYSGSSSPSLHCDTSDSLIYHSM